MILQTGEMVSLIRDKLEVFEDFYECLYCNLNPDRQNIDNLLDNLSVSKIIELHIQSLNHPITIQEIDGAINRLKLGKVPGNGWFRVNFIKTSKCK